MEALALNEAARAKIKPNGHRNLLAEAFQVMSFGNAFWEVEFLIFLENPPPLLNHRGNFFLGNDQNPNSRLQSNVRIFLEFIQKCIPFLAGIRAVF